jgi:hypothetical protein
MAHLSARTHFKLSLAPAGPTRLASLPGAERPGWDALLALVTQLFQLSHKHGPPVLAYTDADGDEILLSSSDELRVRYANIPHGAQLRFTIHTAPSPARADETRADERRERAPTRAAPSKTPFSLSFHHIGPPHFPLGDPRGDAQHYGLGGARRDRNEHHAPHWYHGPRPPCLLRPSHAAALPLCAHFVAPGPGAHSLCTSHLADWRGAYGGLSVHGSAAHGRRRRRSSSPPRSNSDSESADEDGHGKRRRGRSHDADREGRDCGRHQSHAHGCARGSRRYGDLSPRRALRRGAETDPAEGRGGTRRGRPSGT